MSDDNDNPIKQNEEQAELESDDVSTDDDEQIGTADPNDVENEETEKIVGENEAVPAEIDAINTDNTTAAEASSDEEENN